MGLLFFYKQEQQLQADCSGHQAQQKGEVIKVLNREVRQRVPNDSRGIHQRVQDSKVGALVFKSGDELDVGWHRVEIKS